MRLPTLSRSLRLSIALVITFGFCIVEIVFGYMSNSVALAADAFHMLSDVLSLIIGIYAIKLTAKSTHDAKFTFGMGRAEVVGALINCVFLLGLCFTIVIEAIQRLIKPTAIENPRQVLIIGGLGLGINLIGLLLVREPSQSNEQSKAQQYPLINNNASDVESQEHIQSSANVDQKKMNLNMHGVFLHVMGDALNSVAVIVSAIMVIYLSDPTTVASADHPARNHWTDYIDPATSLLITILILISTIPLLRATSHILLQMVPDTIDLEYVKRKLLAIDGVIDLHEVHIWQLSDQDLVASAHILVKDPNFQFTTFTRISRQVKSLLLNMGIQSTTIQLEFCDENTIRTLNSTLGIISDDPIETRGRSDNTATNTTTTINRMGTIDSSTMMMHRMDEKRICLYPCQVSTGEDQHSLIPFHETTKRSF